MGNGEAECQVPWAVLNCQQDFLFGALVVISIHYLSLQRFILFLCAPPGSCSSQLSELNDDVLGTHR